MCSIFHTAAFIGLLCRFLRESEPLIQFALGRFPMMVTLPDMMLCQRHNYPIKIPTKKSVGSESNVENAGESFNALWLIVLIYELEKLIRKICFIKVGPLPLIIWSSTHIEYRKTLSIPRTCRELSDAFLSLSCVKFSFETRVGRPSPFHWRRWRNTGTGLALLEHSRILLQQLVGK